LLSPPCEEEREGEDEDEEDEEEADAEETFWTINVLDCVSICC